MEHADTRTLFEHPLHPYTWSLFHALPRLNNVQRMLVTMRGTAPDMMNPSEKFPFIPRCPKGTNTYSQNPMPALEEFESGHRMACFNAMRYDWDEERSA